MLGALTVLVLSVKASGRPGRGAFGKRTMAIFCGVSCVAIIGFFSAFKFLNAPVWPFHMVLAVFWAWMAVDSYVKFKNGAAN